MFLPKIYKRKLLLNSEVSLIAHPNIRGEERGAAPLTYFSCLVEREKMAIYL